MVYDITRAQSFEVLKKWVCELKNQGPKDVAIAIAGNKADLEDSRVRSEFSFLLCDFLQYLIS